PYGRLRFRCFSSRRARTKVFPSRFLRLRFLPSDRLCRRPALPALILPVPVMRNRFTALRFVFNFGILEFPVPIVSRAFYTVRQGKSTRFWRRAEGATLRVDAEASSLRRLVLRRGRLGYLRRRWRLTLGRPGRMGRSRRVRLG